MLGTSERSEKHVWFLFLENKYNHGNLNATKINAGQLYDRGCVMHHSLWAPWHLYLKECPKEGIFVFTGGFLCKWSKFLNRGSKELKLNRFRKLTSDWIKNPCLLHLDWSIPSFLRVHERDLLWRCSQIMTQTGKNNWLIRLR